MFRRWIPGFSAAFLELDEFALIFLERAADLDCTVCKFTFVVSRLGRVSPSFES